MIVTQLTPRALAASLGVEEDSNALPNYAGLAALLRTAIARWGACRSTAVARYACQTLKACGFRSSDPLDERLRETFDALLSLADIVSVYIEARPLLDAGDLLDEGEVVEKIQRGENFAPAIPRAVAFGEWFLVCGRAEFVDTSSHRGDSAGPETIARWAEGRRRDEIFAAGFDPCEITDWLGVPGQVEHLERRGADERSQLWVVLNDDFEAASGPVDDPRQYSVVVGRPGGYFGRSGERPTGRWASGESAEDGRWLGVRGGYGGKMLPVMVEIEQGVAVRALDLYDMDEWRWALLSRGATVKSPELVNVTANALEFTCPLPRQAQMLAALCSRSPRSSWCWSPPPWVEIATIDQEILRVFMLRLRN